MASEEKSHRKRMVKRTDHPGASFLKRSVVIGAVVSFVLLFAGGLVFLKKGKPLVHGYRAHRAAVTARLALEELKKKEVLQAAAHLKSAIELEAKSTKEVPDVRRACAIFLTRAAQPARAIEVWNRLEQRNELTLDDSMYYLDNLISVGRTSDAKRLIGRLKQEAKTDSWLPGLEARLALRLGAEEDAVPLLRTAVRQEPDNGPMKVELARKLVGSKILGDRREGWAMLRELASDSDTMVVSAAVGLLVNGNQLREDEAARILGLLRTQSNDGKEIPYCDAFVLTASSFSGEKLDAFLMGEIGKAATQGLQDRLVVCRFLRARELYAYVLQLLPPDDETRHPLAKAYRIEAIGNTEGWEKARALLESSGEIDDPSTDILRAHVAKESGRDEAVVIGFLLKAVESAECQGKLEVFALLEDFAAKMGRKDVEIEILTRGLKLPTIAEVSLDRLLNIHQTDSLTLPYSDLLARIPPTVSRDVSAVPTARWLYLSYLGRSDLEGIAKDTRDLYDSEPRSGMNMLLLGWAQYLEGDRAAAAKTLTGIDPGELLNGPRAVYGALATWVGDDALKEKGRQASASVDTGKLLPEEIDCIGSHGRRFGLP